MRAKYFDPSNPECGFYKVEGWIVSALLPVLEFLVAEMRVQQGRQLACLEIGIHHGRFFLFLEQLTPDEEPAVAVDVFGLQQFNMDRSGCGNLSIFKDNVANFASVPSRVHALEMDSTDLLLDAALEKLPTNSYSLISVDGCHTAKHTCLDLLTAGRLLAPGGICILDDINNLSWMDVLTGAVDYLRSPTSNLAPFACGYNKLLLTTLGYQKTYFDHLNKNQDQVAGMKQFPWPKNTTFCGYNVIRYGL